jgi:hypothetical protein
VAIRDDVCGTKATCWRVSSREDVGMWGFGNVRECFITLNYFAHYYFVVFILVTQCWISLMW